MCGTTQSTTKPVTCRLAGTSPTLWMNHFKLVTESKLSIEKGKPMYVNPNFKTKKELKEAIKKGVGVTVFSPGPWPCPTSGVITIEGPHYPKPHKWYAEVMVKDGLAIKVLS